MNTRQPALNRLSRTSSATLFNFNRGSGKERILNGFKQGEFFRSGSIDQSLRTGLSNPLEVAPWTRFVEYYTVLSK